MILLASLRSDGWTAWPEHVDDFIGPGIREGQMHLSPAGEMVWRWWDALEDKYPSLRADAAVVMPNHFHGILVITDGPAQGQAQGQAHRPAPTAKHCTAVHKLYVINQWCGLLKAEFGN